MNLNEVVYFSLICSWQWPILIWRGQFCDKIRFFQILWGQNWTCLLIEFGNLETTPSTTLLLLQSGHLTIVELYEIMQAKEGQKHHNVRILTQWINKSYLILYAVFYFWSFSFSISFDKRHLSIVLKMEKSHLVGILQRYHIHPSINFPKKPKWKILVYKTGDIFFCELELIWDSTTTYNHWRHLVALMRGFMAP